MYNGADWDGQDGNPGSTDVKVSEMTSGVKSFLLKRLDPLFNREGGGAEIPIRVTGTKGDLSFGHDKGRVLRR